MNRQMNMFQIKEQDRIPEELSEREISNLSDKEFKIIITKLFSVLRRRINVHSKKFNNKLENTFKKQS